MNKLEVLEKINNSLFELNKAYNNQYRGKVFVISNSFRIDHYSKTKRGANGYIKRNKHFSYYDEYTMDMCYPYKDLDITEIKIDELTTFDDAELWENSLKEFLGWKYNEVEWFVNCYIDKVTNEELKKDILKNVAIIKAQNGFIKFAHKYVENYLEVVNQVLIEDKVESNVSPIYPDDIRTLDDIKEVIDILVNEVMLDDDKYLMLENLANVEIKLNNKLKRALGRCFSRYSNGDIIVTKLEFNTDFIKYENNNSFKLDTIIHEAMHMLTDLEYNECCYHDERWQTNCKLYGCNPKAVSKHSNYQEEMWKAGIIKYRLICPDCNKVLEYRKNITKQYKNDIEHHRYRCCDCKCDNLIIEKNSK